MGFRTVGRAYALMLVINLSFAAPLAHTLLAPVGLGVLAAAGWPIRHLFRSRPTA